MNDGKLDNILSRSAHSEHPKLVTQEEAQVAEHKRIVSGVEATERNQTTRDEMVALSEALSRTVGCSRLEAATLALRWTNAGVDTWPLLMGPLAPPSGPGEERYPEAASVLKAAWDLADYGFTLNDLIEAVGPDVVIRPKAYKNQLAKLLKHHGFFRKQIRRGETRPLAWFHPKRCGITE